MVRRLLLKIAYDGSFFSGFQRQPNEALQTVQGTLEETLAFLLKEPITIHGAGRTDAGVHAKAQMAHIDLQCQIAPERLQYALNRALPSALVVRDIKEVHTDFHARKWTVGKWYSYLIYNGALPPAIGSQYFTHVPVQMKADLFQQVLEKIEGYHQFEGFCGHGSSVKTYDRTIYLSSLHLSNCQNWWQVHFIGDGFLRKMVRNIIGTAIDVALERRPLSCVEEALETHDRKKAGPTAPSNGLVLERIFYENQALEGLVEGLQKQEKNKIVFPWSTSFID